MHETTRPHRGTVTVAWVLTLAAIFAVTILRSVVDVGGLWDAGAHRQRSLDLTLFDDWFNPTVWYAPLTNTFGNIILFLPVGMLVVLARDAFAPRAVRAPSHRAARSVLVAGLVGFGLSFVVELTQFVFALGFSDVDDLLFNTVGALLGGWLAVVLGRPGRTLATGAIICGSLVVVAVMSAGIPDALAQAARAAG